jgi:hypothetical protein
VRRSLILANSARAMAKKSNCKAKGCPWKLPPLNILSSFGKINGLSVTALISISTNLKITGDYHICDSNKCDTTKYTNTIPYEVESELTEPEYVAYYKNNVLNIKFNKDSIKLNKNVYLDEKHFIVDLINYYLLINIKI